MIDARDRLLGAIADNGLQSCVVLSGDAHAAFVCDRKRHFDDDQAAVIATEFCGTSISTGGRPRTDVIVDENPHTGPAHPRPEAQVAISGDSRRCRPYERAGRKGAASVRRWRAPDGGGRTGGAGSHL